MGGTRGGKGGNDQGKPRRIGSNVRKGTNFGASLEQGGTEQKRVCRNINKMAER